MVRVLCGRNNGILAASWRKDRQKWLFVHDEFGAHAPMAGAAIHTAFKGVGAGGFGDELDVDGLVLLDSPAIPGRRENECGSAIEIGGVGDVVQEEAVIVVDGGDAELDFLAFFDVDNGGQVVEFLSGDINDAGFLLLRLGMRPSREGEGWR